MRTIPKVLLRDLRLLTRLSWPINIAIGLLLIMGVLFIYSACFIREGLEVQGFYMKQIVWAMVGIASYIFFALLDYRRLRKFAGWAYVMCLVLLVLVLFIGETRYGAQRWLMLFGGNGIMIQPSELMKLAMLIFFARIFSRHGVDTGGLKLFVQSLAVMGVPFLLVVKQPDLGTAMIFIPIAFIMMFVGGVPVKYLGILVGIGLFCVITILGVLLLPEKLGVDEAGQEKLMNSIGLKEHQKRRIMVFLNLDKDPLGSGWNKRQSKIAVGSGGAWGKGFKKGRQNILGFLPRSVAPTDFIYSVIAEEKGFLGSLVILILFGTIVSCGMLTAMAARDMMGRLLCVGVSVMIFFHVFINMAMTVGLMPITGLPLPLLSYGGTFMIVIMSALGIIQSVYIRSQRVSFFEHVDRPFRYSA